LKLDEESSVLCELHVLDLEVPGQYFADKVYESRVFVEYEGKHSYLPLTYSNAYFEFFSALGKLLEV
jgi:hypothetical protein